MITMHAPYIYTNTHNPNSTQTTITHAEISTLEAAPRVGRDLHALTEVKQTEHPNMRTHPHEMGLFARVDMRDVNLGPYSQHIASGEEAEEMLARIKRGECRKQVVECVEAPHNWTRQHGTAHELGPFVMHLTPEETNGRDNIPHVRYINDHRVGGGDDLPVNTHITKEGDFIVKNVKAGGELLCSYGHGFNPSARPSALTTKPAARKGWREASEAATKTPTCDTPPKGAVDMSRQEGARHANEYYSGWLAGAGATRGPDETPSIKEIKQWVDRMRHHLLRFTDVGLALRTALDTRLLQEGRPPKLTTRGKPSTPLPVEEQTALHNHALSKLGWKRGADARLATTELLNRRVRQTVRADLDAGKLKPASAYYDNYKHSSKNQATPLEPSELTALIKHIVVEEATRDIGSPTPGRGKVIVHIGAGSAPLLCVANRHGFTAVNIEKDPKDWHARTGTPTHTLRVEDEGMMFTTLAEKFGFHVEDIAAVLVSLDCATNCRMTAINEANGTRHRNARDEPITQRARDEEALTVYVRDEILDLVSTFALRGKTIMHAFEHGKATCFRDVFLPTVGTNPRYTTTAMRFSEPKLLNWWDYGAPMSKLTHWFTNYARLWHLKPSTPRLKVAVVVNTAAEGEARKRLPKVQGLTVKESKAAWPPMFLDSVLAQWTGLHNLPIKSTHTGFQGLMPFTQTLGSATDIGRCAALAAQQNRISAHGYPWRAIDHQGNASGRTAAVWGTDMRTPSTLQPHTGVENSAYLESAMRDAWILHDRKEGWVWAHEGYGDVMWDSRLGELQVLLAPWNKGVRPGSDEDHPRAQMVTHTETHLHELKVTKMKEVLSTKTLNRGFAEGIAQGSTTGRTFRCSPSKTCMNCKLKRSKSHKRATPSRSSCGIEHYRIVYPDGYTEDLTAQEVWRTIVWSDAPPGFLMYLRGMEDKTQGPRAGDARTQEQWVDDMEHEQTQKCFL